MKYTVDRIEGKYAVCEDENRKMKEIELELLPEGVKEGDVLEFENGAWYADSLETETRAERIKSKMDALWG